MICCHSHVPRCLDENVWGKAIFLWSSLLPRRFQLVHWLNSWFLLVDSSSSKIAKRLSKDCREKVNFVCSPRISNYVLFVHRKIYWCVVQAILKYYRRVLNVIVKKSSIIIITRWQLNRVENSKYIIAYQRTILKVKKEFLSLVKKLNSISWPIPFRRRWEFSHMTEYAHFSKTLSTFNFSNCLSTVSVHVKNFPSFCTSMCRREHEQGHVYKLDWRTQVSSIPANT